MTRFDEAAGDSAAGSSPEEHAAPDDAPTGSTGGNDSPVPADSRPTTAEEAMDADTVEDGFIEESAYGPSTAARSADHQRW
jgi:hypothetical protein